eukprot:scaffold7213_cov166-Amphora_coffeaeformis.AAC.21
MRTTQDNGFVYFQLALIVAVRQGMFRLPYHTSGSLCGATNDDGFLVVVTVSLEGVFLGSNRHS